MSDEEYSDICVKLDVLALDILNLMQRIVEERNRLDLFLKNGFADMAKSRYVMGSNSVSVLQINESEITALRKIQSEDSSNNNVQFECFNVVEDKVESNSKTLRQRKKEVEELTEKTENCKISDSEPSKEVPQNLDPLKWFGVLVPQSLRSAQSNFKESVFAAVHITSLQNELNAISKEYTKLCVHKKVLKDGQTSKLENASNVNNENVKVD